METFDIVEISEKLEKVIVPLLNFNTREKRDFASNIIELITGQKDLNFGKFGGYKFEPVGGYEMALVKTNAMGMSENVSKFAYPAKLSRLKYEYIGTWFKNIYKLRYHVGMYVEDKKHIFVTVIKEAQNDRIDQIELEFWKRKHHNIKVVNRVPVRKGLLYISTFDKTTCETKLSAISIIQVRILKENKILELQTGASYMSHKKKKFKIPYKIKDDIMLIDRAAMEDELGFDYLVESTRSDGCNQLSFDFAFEMCAKKEIKKIAKLAWIQIADCKII